MSKGQLLGIDLGEVRTGVAICDDEQRMAVPLTTFEKHSREQLVAEILKLCHERQITGIVVGMPFNMDGSEGPKARQAREFGRLLAENSAPPVHFQDERLSSWEAEGKLIEAGLKPRQRKSKIDAIAAQTILQSWLDANRS
ncbi:MAG: Holliday junction resolvase RuvX [Planctomycetes bacterium]|nr:Holliday junction resolvase RuvX [Planctomycetota bacterium]NUQ34446.1 Holliday junction resolvase RuvX [Planctomycetaceae bacterium]